MEGSLLKRHGGGTVENERCRFEAERPPNISIGSTTILPTSKRSADIHIYIYTLKVYIHMNMTSYDPMFETTAVPPTHLVSRYGTRSGFVSRASGVQWFCTSSSRVVAKDHWAPAAMALMVELKTTRFGENCPATCLRSEINLRLIWDDSRTWVHFCSCNKNQQSSRSEEIPEIPESKPLQNPRCKAFFIIKRLVPRHQDQPSTRL